MEDIGGDLNPFGDPAVQRAAAGVDTGAPAAPPAAAGGGGGAGAGLDAASATAALASFMAAVPSAINLVTGGSTGAAAPPPPSLAPVGGAPELSPLHSWENTLDEPVTTTLVQRRRRRGRRRRKGRGLTGPEACETWRGPCRCASCVRWAPRWPTCSCRGATAPCFATVRLSAVDGARGLLRLTLGCLWQWVVVPPGDLWGPLVLCLLLAVYVPRNWLVDIAHGGANLP